MIAWCSGQLAKPSRARAVERDPLVRNADPVLSLSPIARALDVVGDRWSLLIIQSALNGVCRFSGFQTTLGIAKNILAERLRHLVECGVLSKTPVLPGSRYSDYALTEKGRNLRLAVAILHQWGEHLPDQSSRSVGHTVPSADIFRVEGSCNAAERMVESFVGNG